jgi:hypothetical protein
LAPQLPDQLRGLEEDPPGNLRLARRAVREYDRHLDDHELRALAQVVHLDLIPVTIGAHPVQVERLKDVSTEALEPARAVFVGILTFSARW